MNVNTLLSILTCVVAMTSLGRGHGVTVIDLTHKLKAGESLTWPTNPRYNFSILFRGYHSLYHTWIENNEFRLAEHTGTHMDAPAHFTEGGWRMHQIPPQNLVGPGVMIDVKDKVKNNPVYKVTIDDIKAWETQHGMIPDKAVVMLNAGWSSRYPDWNQVFNTNNLTDIESFKMPSISLEAAAWLLTQRKLLALGVDSPSPELGPYRYPVHRLLLSNNVIILESVANMDSMPVKGSTVVIGALNLYDGSGAPMRLLALVGGPQTSNGACRMQQTSAFGFALTVAAAAAAAAVAAAMSVGLVVAN